MRVHSPSTTGGRVDCSLIVLSTNQIISNAQIFEFPNDSLNEQETGDATLAFIGHIFGYDQNMAVVDGYRVVSEDDPDVTLYAFWRFAYAVGVLFHAGSVATTGIEMDESSFASSRRATNIKVVIELRWASARI